MVHENLKVCLVQANLHWMDVDANIRMFDRIIDEQADGADLVVLPEMFSTGFSMEPEKVAEPLGGPASSWMRDKACLSAKAIVGSIIMVEDGRFFNRLIFATPTGEVFFYDKRHLFRMGNEHEHFTAGSQRLIVTFKGWRICPLICYDLRFPVWSRCCNDYDLVLYIASWPAARRYVWQSLLVARAIENQCYAVGVNRVGTDGEGLCYSGNSVVVDPKGEVSAPFADGEAGAASLVLSMSSLLSFREKFPVLLDGDRFQILG